MPGWLRCAQPFSKAALFHQLHLTVRGNGQALVTEQAVQPAIMSTECTDLGLDPAALVLSRTTEYRLGAGAA